MTFRGTPFETTMKFFSVRMLSIRDKATHRNQKLRETLLTRLSVTACLCRRPSEKSAHANCGNCH